MPLYRDIIAPDAAGYLTRVIHDKSINLDQHKFAANSIGSIQTLQDIKPTAAWKMMSALPVCIGQLPTESSG